MCNSDTKIFTFVSATKVLVLCFTFWSNMRALRHHKNVYFVTLQRQNFTEENLALHVMMVDSARC